MSWQDHLVRVLDPTGLLPVGVIGGKDGEPDYDLLIWESEDVPRPTKEEFEAAIEKAKQLEYRSLRRVEYPSITDQLDSLFHAGVFPPEMAAQIQAVKDQFPKPPPA